jgi:hypothetical protein
VDHVADQLKLDPETVMARRAITAQSARGLRARIPRRYATLVGESPADIEACTHDARMPRVSRICQDGHARIEPDAFRPSLGVLPARRALAGDCRRGVVGDALSRSPVPPSLPHRWRR